LPSDRTAEYSFWDHLDEVRNGVIRSLIYVAVGTVAGWLLRTHIFVVLEWPALYGARLAGVTDFKFRIFEPVAGIMLMMYAALIFGVVVAAPLWLWELVRFVNPGLTPRERKLTYWFIPGFFGLFLAGVVFCYFLAFAFCAFLLHFNHSSFAVAPEWTLGSYLRFLMQCLVGTGILFELPVVLMFMVWLGLASSEGLKKHWRAAVVVILVVVAIVTPTPDPFTMTIVSLPLVGLYFLSVSLARWVERSRARVAAAGEVEGAPSEDDPYGLTGGAGGLEQAEETPDAK